jgi:hypothetical protein
MKELFLLSSLVLSQAAFGQACVNTGFESTPLGPYTTSNAVTGWTLTSRQHTSCMVSTTTWTPGSPDFAILATPISDGYIGTIPHSPLGGTVVARLNDNNTSDYVATRLTQSFPVSSGNSYFNFAFASMLDDGTHNFCCENPSLYFNIRDINGNVLSCFSESVVPTANCGSAVSLTISGGSGYTNWQTRSFNLSSLIGSTVTIEVIAADCNFGAHRAYMYFDAQCSNVPANCNCYAVNNASMVNLCAGSSQAIVNAPAGMTNYSWTVPSGVIVPSGQFTLSSISASNVSTGQVFSVVATSSAGCQSLTTYTLLYTNVGAGTQSVSASCMGGATGTATLFPTGSGHGYSFTWYNATNSVVNTASVAANLPPGTYSVNISAPNAAGCGTVSTSVIIPSVGVSYSISNSGSSYSLCSGSNVMASAAISGTAPSNAFTYSWSPSVFLASTNQQAALITPTAAVGGSATIIYSLVVTPTNINCPNQQTVQVFVGNPATATLGAVQALCSNSPTVQISASPSNGVFSAGAGLNSAGVITPSLSATGSNFFVYSLSLAGCVKTTNGSYTVYSSPQLSVSATPTICSGGSASLAAAGAGMYLWSNSSTSQTLIVSPSVTTTYSVTGTNSPGNCKDSSAVTVSVFPSPALLIAGPDSACAGKPAVLVASGANNYQWNGSQSAGTSTVFPVIGVNSYTLTGTYTASGCQATLAHTIHGIPQPTVTMSGNFTLCAGETLSLIAGGATYYSWNNSHNGPTFTAVPSGNMLVTLAATNEGVCYSSLTRQVSVDACTGMSAPPRLSSLKAYFDRANGILVVEDARNTTLQVLDIQGRILCEMKPEENTARLDMSRYSEGIYLLRANSGGATHTQKIIVTR